MSGRPGAAQISLTRPTVEMIDRLCLLLGQNRQAVIHAAVALLEQRKDGTGPSDHAVVMAGFPGGVWNVPKVNPHVRDRVAAVNGRCLTQDGRTHMRIDPQATHLISDLEQVIFAENGELDKKSNPMLTHISDALGYWVHQDWPPVSRTAAATAHMGFLL